MKTRILWILLLLPFTMCANSHNDARQFVFNLFSHYQNNKTGFSSINPKSIDTIFSPEFLNLMRLNEKQDQEGLGYDPVCDCQDDDGFKMGKIDITIQDGIEYAMVKFKISETEYSIKLKLVNKNAKWFIADIITSRGSLYDLLKKNVSAQK